MLDTPAVLAGAEALRARLEGARQDLEKIRRAGAPIPPPDKDQPPPHDVPPRRADALLPFLLIRTFPGDIGARPIDFTRSLPAFWSPDIVVTTHVAVEPTVLGRAGYATIAGRIVREVQTGVPYDVWVHVWNLGRAPAYGVRVRAWSRGRADAPPGQFLGGRRLDLGDRSSETSHLLVKIGPWTQPNGYTYLWASAECITDVATYSGEDDRFEDRHNAMRIWWFGTTLPW